MKKVCSQFFFFNLSFLDLSLKLVENQNKNEPHFYYKSSLKNTSITIAYNIKWNYNTSFKYISGQLYEKNVLIK